MEKLTRKLFHQCVMHIDEVFRPNFPLKRESKEKLSNIFLKSIKIY